MPRIEQLRNYPVAGMEGQEVNQLVITPEAIEGNRSFAIVLESELEEFISDPEHIPLRLTQVKAKNGKTVLTRLQAADVDGKLTIQDLDSNSNIELQESVVVEESRLPFYDQEEVSNAQELIANYAIPLKVARKSKSLRWAQDCGDEVASWLSNKIGRKVRLVKAVRHPEAKKHHFTWYTQVHAVMKASLDALAQEAGVDVDPLSFRYNVLLADTQEDFEEKSWNQAVLAGVEALVTACERCGYIGIERATGAMAQHMEVLNVIMQKHKKNFGVYLEPQGDSFRIVLNIGDEIQASSVQSS